jgi:hypothetical protein
MADDLVATLPEDEEDIYAEPSGVADAVEADGDDADGLSGLANDYPGDDADEPEAYEPDQDQEEAASESGAAGLEEDTEAKSEAAREEKAAPEATGGEDTYADDAEPEAAELTEPASDEVRGIPLVTLCGSSVPEALKLTIPETPLPRHRAQDPRSWLCQFLPRSAVLGAHLAQGLAPSLHQG